MRRPTDFDPLVANCSDVMACLDLWILSTFDRILSMLLRCFALALLVVLTAAEGPCDILDAAGNPCVAAHSTVRALYGKYDGPLYNVTRSSDNTSINIGLLSIGGFADKPAHDAFW
jgi:hypothetical protein